MASLFICTSGESYSKDEFLQTDVSDLTAPTHIEAVDRGWLVCLGVQHAAVAQRRLGIGVVEALLDRYQVNVSFMQSPGIGAA